MTEIGFYVEGRPAPQGSKRAFPNGGMVEMSRYVKPWRAAVNAAARHATQGRTPINEPVRMRVAFYIARPKGHYGTGRNAGTVKQSAPAYPSGPPDTSKLLRATEDALTGVVFRDDALIVSCLAEKFWATTTNQPGAYIRVSTIKGEI